MGLGARRHDDATIGLERESRLTATPDQPSPLTLGPAIQWWTQWRGRAHHPNRANLPSQAVSTRSFSGMSGGS